MEYTVSDNKSGTLEVYAETIGSSEEAYSFTSQIIVLPEGTPNSLSTSREYVLLPQVHDTYQLAVTGTYPDDREFDLTESVTGTTYTTRSGTEDVIAVSSEGLIEARGEGQDAVIIMNAGHSVTVDVYGGELEVSRESIVSLRAARDTIQLTQAGDIDQLQILGVYENGEEHDITSDAKTTYTLQSGTEDVITVSAEGLIKAQTEFWDAEMITVTHSGHSIEVAVRVGTPPTLKQARELYFREKNYSGAARLCWYLAEEGDIDVQSMLGYLYNHGHGIAQNTGMAIKWYQKAADRGHVIAQSALALIYATTNDPTYRDGPKALEYALKATEQSDWWGDLESLAAAYARNGQFEQAIETQEQAISALEKVTFTESGRGEDYKAQALERFELYKNHQAYTEEEPDQANEPGKDTSFEDYARRLEAYQQHQSVVNDKNNTQALPVISETSGEFLKNRARGLFNAHNYSEAFPLYQELAEQGDAEAQYYLGIIYRHGLRVVSKDFEKAFELWLTSAEQGYADAQNALAACYAAHKDPQYQDGQKAVEYALKANEQKPETWNFVGTLAAAYARNGQFEEAITTHKKATVLAQQSLPEGPGKDRLLEDYARRLEFYQQHQAYVEETF